jgi:two-component system, OmpR family, sensor histidine kinase BaeS
VIALALTVAGATLVAGALGALLVRRLPSIHARLVGLALLATFLPLAAVALSGVARYHMGADVVILAVCTASASVAVLTALLVTSSISAPLRRLRTSVRDLAAGDLGVRAQRGGPGEIVDIATAFNDMAARVEDALDARRELVAWASHDLRTPLTGLQATIEAVEDGLVEPDHYLAAMRQNVEALGRLVDGLAELVRADAGALSMDLRPGRLGPVVDACVTAMAPMAAAAGILIERDLPPDLPEVAIDPGSIERVLLNLVGNALKFTPAGGSVTVRAARARAGLEVSVEDSGPGVPAADERIFERFWRGDPIAAGGQRGDGLGLAIAKSLVEAHGGRIHAERREGPGARIVFTLPALASPTAPAAIAQRSSA